MPDNNAKIKIYNDVVFLKNLEFTRVLDKQSVFVWDLDKTYLDSHFESLSGLIRIIREKAFQKKNVPGTRSLVRALTLKGESFYPIYFITASPPQMQKRISEKLHLDGIKPYGIFFKDNLKNLKPGRFRRLSQQVGFKLQALLYLRSKLPENVRQILWGDDSESDAVIYSLYSDICSRRIPKNSLRNILSHFHVRGEQTEVIFELQDKIPISDPVERIFINLANDTDPDYYSKFGRRTLATYNTFQVALDLVQEKVFDLAQMVLVARDLILNYNFTQEELAFSFNDLIFRRVLCENTVEDVMQVLKEELLIPQSFIPRRKPISSDELKQLKYEQGKRLIDSWLPQFVDYLHDFR